MRVYLDHNATTFPFPEVWDKVCELRGLALGNPSSTHREGRVARQLVEDSRTRVAAFLGASPQEVVFTSGGTEANATALWGWVRVLGGPMGVRMYVGATEHPSVFAAAEAVAALGATLEVLPVDARGMIVPTSLSRVQPPAVVCVQLANHETGVIQPVETVVAAFGDASVFVHCDAVQAVGKIPVSFPGLGVHSLALSGHKLGGLPGAGALLIRQGVDFPALVPGEQEGRKRGGTEALLPIVALGWACTLLRERVAGWGRVGKLRDDLERAIEEQIPEVTVFGRDAPRVPNTSCLGLPHPFSGSVAVAALDLAGFAVSSGPACSSGASLPSVVVEAMGFGEWAERTIRVSLGLETGKEDVDRFVVALKEILERGQ